MPDWLSNFVSTFVLGYGVKIVGGIILLIVGFALVKWFTKLLKNGKIFKKLDTTVRGFLASFINVALKLFIILTAVILVGVPAASVVALLGSCGLAIGLALQGGLSNLAGGLLILVLKPYKIGDYISCCGGEGTVSDIGVFYTTLLTLDNSEITIPNGSVSSSTIKNFSAEKLRRVDLDFAVSSACDLDTVRSILLGVISADSRIITDIAYDAVVCEITAASTTFRTRAWCEGTVYWDVYFDTIEAVKRAFAANNVEVPLQKMGVKNLD